MVSSASFCITTFFKLEVGISDRALQFIRKAKTKYIRALYKYIRQKEPNPFKATERMANILMLLPVLTVKFLFLKRKIEILDT